MPLLALLALGLVTPPHVAWESVHARRVPAVVRTYFGADADAGEQCDVFLIDGVPASCMLYRTEARRTRVAAFHVNRAMLEVFDAGCAMRYALFQRHGRLVVEHAKNRNEFLTV